MEDEVVFWIQILPNSRDIIGQICALNLLYIYTSPRQSMYLIKYEYISNLIQFQMVQTSKDLDSDMEKHLPITIYKEEHPNQAQRPSARKVGEIMCKLLMLNISCHVNPTSFVSVYFFYSK